MANMATRFLVDCPLECTDDLRFGHLEVSKALAELIDNAVTPFTIALYGGWGTGKSTILNITAKLLESKVPVIVFDVWKYEHDDLRRSFLLLLADSLKREGLLDQEFQVNPRVDKSIKGEISGDSKINWNYLGTGGWLLFVFILGVVSVFIILGLIIQFLFPMHSTIFWSIAFAVIGGGTLGSIVNATVIKYLHAAVTVDAKSYSEDRFAFPEEFEEEYIRIMSAANCERICIAFDNIDRIASMKAISILSLIKNFLEPDIKNRKIVYVVPCDRTAIATQIKQMFGNNNTNHHIDECLRKFFNVSLDVPRFLQTELEQYTIDLLKQTKYFDTEIDTLAAMITIAFKDNPRQMKQFINVLISNLIVIEQYRDSKDSIGKMIADDRIGIAMRLLIEHRSPSMVHVISKSGSIYYKDVPLYLEYEEEIVPQHELEMANSLLRNFSGLCKHPIQYYKRLHESEHERKLVHSENALLALKTGMISEFQKIYVDCNYSESQHEYSLMIKQALFDTNSLTTNKILIHSLLLSFCDESICNPTEIIRVAIAESLYNDYRNTLEEFPVELVFDRVLLPAPFPTVASKCFIGLQESYISLLGKIIHDGSKEGSSPTLDANNTFLNLMKITSVHKDRHLREIAKIVSSKEASTDYNLIKAVVDHEQVRRLTDPKFIEYIIESLSKPYTWMFFGEDSNIDLVYEYTFQPIVSLVSDNNFEWTKEILLEVINLFKNAISYISRLEVFRKEFLDLINRAMREIVEETDSDEISVIHNVNEFINGELANAYLHLSESESPYIVKLYLWLEDHFDCDAVIQIGDGKDILIQYFDRINSNQLDIMLNSVGIPNKYVFNNNRYFRILKQRALNNYTLFKVIMPHLSIEQRTKWFVEMVEMNVVMAVDWCIEEKYNEIVISADPISPLLMKLQDTIKNAIKFKKTLIGLEGLSKRCNDSQNRELGNILIEGLFSDIPDIGIMSRDFMINKANFVDSLWRELLRKIIDQLVDSQANVSDSVINTIELVRDKSDLLSEQEIYLDKFIDYVLSGIVIKCLQNNETELAEKGLRNLRNNLFQYDKRKSYYEDIVSMISSNSNNVNEGNRLLEILLEDSSKAKGRYAIDFRKKIKKIIQEKKGL